jgi:hypothetical protein
VKQWSSLLATVPTPEIFLRLWSTLTKLVLQNQAVISEESHAALLQASKRSSLWAARDTGPCSNFARLYKELDWDAPDGVRF